MRWEFGRRSTNIEDRRGMRPSRGVVGGGLGALLLALLVALLGGDPSMVLNQSPVYEGPAQVAPAPPQDDRAAAFVSTVLGYTEDTWSEIFREKGSKYVEPKLVLFSGVVNSGCGTAQSSISQMPGRALWAIAFCTARAAATVGSCPCWSMPMPISMMKRLRVIALAH